MWSHPDQDPVPVELRTWTWKDYVGYWISDLVNITSWQIGSTSMIVGLGTADAIVIVLLSGIFNGLPTVLNGYPGSDFHISFPVAIRASYGFYFAIFCVITRALLAAIWFGVNTYWGLFAVTEAIAAIWPSYRTIPNHLPPSAGISTQQMTSFLLFNTIQLPFLLIPVRKLNKVFIWKAIIVIPMAIAMVIWICVKAGNVKGIFNQSATVHGSQRIWLWLATLSSMTNSWLTNALSMSDFSRFSKTRSSAWAQIPAIPIIKTIYAILGIATVGAGRVLYQEDIWSPIDILPKWTGHGGRFLAFCCAVLWIFAQISCNVSANAAPFGHDAMSLLPRWINVRRGSVICLILGAWAMVPWLLVNTAGKFLALMSAYGTFVCPMCSILFTDYFLVRKRKLDVPGLYDPKGRYQYLYGCNWRALVVQFGFIALYLPGVINSVTPSISVGEGYIRLYQLNRFVNTFGTIIMYWGLCVLFPPVESLVMTAAQGTIISGRAPDGNQSEASSRSESEKH